ncbi:ankyrin repeat domain-containing protein [Leptospira sp. 2 VSF19]|uniref:Ankyrin repeat domain-containing protein n=1 Tax=Leptospira soteropolitanensis TaxID=2950025 RepID=A0AAW5VJV2_9LEPT|nr:ankyrin repeat domain-containing protein [Leptospira soteropolitanensis]MCW7492331.1 ankyrin repeat domain-containing protein [Leptospira soteropolitanensis]MCW7499913.1 ankyrin repeat domain-containing protein [Leptospira soteropolitanensis]MCW7522164.1 ankyrin repeat domain-containing protein [Leptospira soteropolitanensis]MCW7526018.1 ankyrin repeat domain-containing protein [Leptospira soteropolitanensis]MCW7529868.1 ankyrin repeat domain-containing protein [Leptospira soteropolitanensi
MKKLIPLFLLWALVSCSSLPYTIEDRKFDKAKQMIEGGADVNHSSDCFHPLTIAAMEGDEGLVKLLLDKGAKVDNRSKECDYTDRIGPFRMKFRWGARTALDRVANAKIAKLLLAKGANPNIAGYREYTFAPDFDVALWNAVRIADLELVKVLVEAGANVNVYNHSGKNAIWEMAEARKSQKKTEFLSYLQSKGMKKLEITDAKAKTTDGKILTKYKHIATGAITEMPSDIAKGVYENPKNYSALTINAADGAYYHYAEFVWEETGQNLYEWYLLRRKRTGTLK